MHMLLHTSCIKWAFFPLLTANSASTKELIFSISCGIALDSETLETTSLQHCSREPNGQLAPRWPLSLPKRWTLILKDNGRVSRSMPLTCCFNGWKSTVTLNSMIHCLSNLWIFRDLIYPLFPLKLTIKSSKKLSPNTQISCLCNGGLLSRAQI